MRMRGQAQYRFLHLRPAKNAEVSLYGWVLQNLNDLSHGRTSRNRTTRAGLCTVSKGIGGLQRSELLAQLLAA